MQYRMQIGEAEGGGGGGGEGEGEGEGDMDVVIAITCYMLPIDYLSIACLIALNAHMLSDNGYGPGLNQ